MAKTGLKRNAKTYLRLKALHDVSQEFANAMCDADANFVIFHKGGEFTPRMGVLWARYIQIMAEYAKHG